MQAAYQCVNWDYYSAFAWFTLRSLYDDLESRGMAVPLGGIAQSYGGTSIQWWSSPESIQECHAPAGSSCCNFGGIDSCLWFTQVCALPFLRTQGSSWLQPVRLPSWRLVSPSTGPYSLLTTLCPRSIPPHISHGAHMFHGTPPTTTTTTTTTALPRATVGMESVWDRMLITSVSMAPERLRRPCPNTLRWLAVVVTW